MTPKMPGDQKWVADDKFDNFGTVLFKTLNSPVRCKIRTTFEFYNSLITMKILTGQRSCKKGDYGQNLMKMLRFR